MARLNARLNAASDSYPTRVAVMTLFAWIVHRKLGLRLLRTAWFNLDWLWAGALVVTGAVVLLT